ncbi:MAG: hypothetical protein JW940_03740 [Polyangiaceae bacterium]|nr:hypothetical protein [Polyangiaceae bacterium]
MTSSDPATTALAAPAKELVDALKAQWLVRLETADQETMARALLDRADLDLDQACRALELELLTLVQKDRGATEYRAVFPDGLVAVVALRGTAQSRKVEQMVTAMRERLPALAEKHASRLLELAGKMIAAEKALADAHQAHDMAFGKERLLRADLVRQLRRNEGALLVIYPGKKSLVRAFFPRQRGGSAEENDDGGDVAVAAAEAAAPSPAAGG